MSGPRHSWRRATPRSSASTRSRISFRLRRSSDQAKFAYQEAVNGHTKEERAIARANVVKAQSYIDTIKAQVDELVVRAPVASQVYQIGAELGDYVSPGVPLLSLVDLNDVWLRFNLREDLVKGLKVGDRFDMRPALGNRPVTAAVKFIAAKGNMRAGGRHARPAILTCGLSRCGHILSSLSRSFARE